MYAGPSLAEIQQRTKEQLGSFHAGIKRFTNPHQYPVGLEKGVFERKTELILKARHPREEPQLESILQG